MRGPRPGSLELQNQKAIVCTRTQGNSPTILVIRHGTLGLVVLTISRFLSSPPPHTMLNKCAQSVRLETTLYSGGEGGGGGDGKGQSGKRAAFVIEQGPMMKTANLQDVPQTFDHVVVVKLAAILDWGRRGKLGRVQRSDSGEWVGLGGIRKGTDSRCRRQPRLKHPPYPAHSVTLVRNLSVLTNQWWQLRMQGGSDCPAAGSSSGH